MKMIKSRFKIMTVILLLMLFILPITSLKVEATTTGSGTDADGPAATQTAIGGPSHNKTGWLIYVMDESNNTLLSSSVPFYYCNLASDGLSVDTLKTRFGDNCSGSMGKIPDYIGEPFDESGRGRGAEIKQVLVTPQDNGQSGAVMLMEAVWGIEFVESLSTNPNWVLCLESVYWYSVYIGGQPTDIVYIGTAKMIGEYQNHPALAAFLTPIGDSWINKLTNDLMSAQGYGMIQAWSVDGNMIIVYNIYCKYCPVLQGCFFVIYGQDIFFNNLKLIEGLVRIYCRRDYSD